MITFIAGCSGSPPRQLSQCPDSDCMTEWIDKHWPDDPQAVLEAVRVIPDPVVRATLITHMGETYPGSAAELCREMSHGPERERCQTLNTRPHLWQIDEETPESGSKGSGQVFNMLISDLTVVDDPWLQVAPEIHTCEDSTSFNTCQTNAGISLAEAGRIEEAGQACLGLEEHKWRYECFFLASQVAVDDGGATSASARLCLGSGYFLYRCFGHLAASVGNRAPQAASGQETEWRQLNEAVLGMSGEISSQSPELADRCVHLAFSAAMIRAYWNEGPLVGIPWELLDERALPHGRGMVAWRLGLEEADPNRSLDQWADRIEEVLASRGIASEPAMGRENSPRGAAIGGFDRELPGEQDLPWVAYMEVTRRAFADDPHDDAAICALEAIVRNDKRAGHPLIAKALKHRCREVRWTAARLAGKFAPGLLLSPAVRGEVDPLVRGRIETIVEIMEVKSK